MRTTLTLDDDVAAAIERRRREREHSLKQEVNDLLRAGLARVEEGELRPAQAPTFRVEPFSTGGLLVPIDDVSEALEVAEGPWYR
jgi:plasmid stability protein